MKAALLSFHNAFNYGAALQAYALQYAVESLGVDCEYINYQNEFRRHAYDMKYHFKSSLKNKDLFGAVKSFIGAPVMSARSKSFHKFYSTHLKTTKKIFANSEEAKKLNSLYDKFIVGSDQVWNYTNNGGDTAYLLDFVDDDKKKISYASSFGMGYLSNHLENVYSEYLRKFNRLSTREIIGTEIIENITGRKAHLVLDPVFLVGVDEWEKIREKNAIHKKKHIFFYTNRQSQIQDFLNTGYDKGDEYHVLSTHLTPKEILNTRIKIRVSMSPGEFLDEISSADLVVTASFHCLALSIIFHKQFVAILTGDYGKDERITNLLRISGLENRVLTSTTNTQDIDDVIDYDEVDRRLKLYQNESREYLRRALYDEHDIAADIPLKNDMFCQDSRCTGCGACAVICPCQAISMETNAEGFRVPSLDESKCVHCHKCHVVCQVYAKKDKVVNQQYYAVKNRDEIRRNSSSGGMFRALAERILAEKGIVCAAGMDKDFHVYHMFAYKIEELQPMCGTYYVQSDLRDAYKKVETYLKDRKKVLFIGTACQVAGLNYYLGKKYSNLLTCDILCHGAPSPMVFDRFIDYLRTKGNLSSLKFRDKTFGWKGYHVSAIIDGKLVKDKLWLQSFNNLFSHNMINRLSCGSCQYTNYDRPGDITIGDFWGIENSHKEFIDRLGVSLVIINTDTGGDIFKKLNVEMIETKKNDTVQNSLMRPAPVSSRRLQIFQSLKCDGYEKMSEKFAEVNIKGAAKNIIRKAYILIKQY